MFKYHLDFFVCNEMLHNCPEEFKLFKITLTSAVPILHP